MRQSKILLLHGGQGADHTYFECFEDFLPQNGVEFELDSTTPTSLAARSSGHWNVSATRWNRWGEHWVWSSSICSDPRGRHAGNRVCPCVSGTSEGAHHFQHEGGLQAYEKHVAVLRAALPADAIATLDKYEKAGNFEAPK
jgi:hypothetical protein